MSARESVDGFRMNESCSEETDSTLFPQRRKEGQTNFSYGLILAQVLQWRPRAARNPKPAVVQQGFQWYSIYTAWGSGSSLQQTAAYTTLSIISHSIHENRSTVGCTLWTRKTIKRHEGKKRELPSQNVQPYTVAGEELRTVAVSCGGVKTARTVKAAEIRHKEWDWKNFLLYNKFCF